VIRNILGWDRNIADFNKCSVFKSGHQKKYSYYIIALVLSLCAGCQTTPTLVQERISSTEVKDRRLIGGKSIDPNATTPPLVIVHPTATPLVLKQITGIEEASGQDHSRLVAFQLQYENPVKFQHYINIRQVNKKIECGHKISLYLSKENSGHILLIDFPPECGGQVELSLSACKPAIKLSHYDKCQSSEIYAERILKLKIPEKDQLLYAGKLEYRLDDIYPHRGTSNFPVYKFIEYTYEQNASFDKYFENGARLKGYKLVYGKGELTIRR
jgi:hypothetical protein